MDRKDLLRRADENFCEAWRINARFIEGGEIAERDGVVMIATGLPAAMFNVAFVLRPPAEPAAAVKRAIAFFGPRGAPWLFRVREGVDPASESAAQEAGLRPAGALPVMVLRDAGLPPASLPGLEVREVRLADLEAMHGVLAGGFGTPPEFGPRLVPPAALDALEARFYIGYADGKPAATAAMMRTGDCAGVYNVATLPGFRGRGFGEALTRAAVLGGAALGCTFSCLQASEMGQPVYERMGYEVVAHYRTFQLPGR